MLFAELESVLLCWPDQLPLEIQHQSAIYRSAVLIRRQRWQQAEALLLAEQAQSTQAEPALLWLLGYLAFCSASSPICVNSWLWFQTPTGAIAPSGICT